MEVNDVENNLEKIKTLLASKGFKNIQLDKEKGFEKTKLVNIYATRN